VTRLAQVKVGKGPGGGSPSTRHPRLARSPPPPPHRPAPHPSPFPPPHHPQAEIDNKRADLASSGMSPEEVEGSVQGDIAEAVAAVEEEMTAAHGVEHFAVLQAQGEYGNDPDVQNLMKRLRVVFFGEAALAQFEAAVPPEVDSDAFFEIFSRQMATMDDAFRSTIAEVKRVTKSVPPADRETYLEYLLGQRLAALHGAAIRAAGLTEEQYGGCMIKYGNEPRVVELVMKSQMENERIKREALG
jgi:hypothetical protein